MKGKVCYLAGFLFLLNTFIYAKSNVEEKNATNLESWAEEFDLNGKKAGKYNIVVTATDTGGNTTLAGPLNVFIDPNSDLPVCGITNPYTGMVTGNNLNVVGTCVDDDAVASVELVFDNDSEHPVIAEGKDFWSYYLNTTNLSEGPHSISVTGVDINGLRGKPRTVSWELNRHAPQTELTSHVMGTLVSGKQKIAGTVSDGSGIKDIAYSINQGKTFIPVKLSFNKKSKAYTFEFSLDTKQLADGPQVIWFLAHDSLNTQGMYSFLLFVDNTVPEVKIVSPAETHTVNGIFPITGYAKDTVGLKALSWTCGKQSGTLDLIPGNPFFTFNCDMHEENAKTVEIVISATDTAGNMTKAVRKQPFNQEQDEPIISLFSPSSDNVSDGQLTLLGFASDDDAVAEVDYFIDSQSANIQKIETEGLFSDIITEKYGKLSAGSHSVTIWAKDINGVIGKKTSAKFTVAGDKPSFGQITVAAAADPDPAVKGEKTRTYVPSMEIHPESLSTINTTVTSPCGLQSVSYQFTGSDPQNIQVKKGDLSASIQIPMIAKRWGNTSLTITAADIYGRTSASTTQYFITNLSLSRGGNAQELASQITNSDSIAIISVGDTPSTAGMQAVCPSTLTASITSATVPAVSYTINNGLVTGKAKVAKTGDSFTAIIPLEKLPAHLAQIKLSVAASKTAPAEATAFVYIVRDKSSVDTIEDSAKIYWMQSEKGRYIVGQNESVTGTANFALPVTVDFAASVSAAVRSALTVTADNNSITITPQAEGLFDNIAVVVTDANGTKHTSDSISILCDYSAPVISFVLPAPYEWLRTKLSSSFTVHDNSSLAKTEYAVYQSGTKDFEWKEVSSGNKSTGGPDASLSVNSPLDSLEDGPVTLSVRATDASGKQTVSSLIMFKDTKGPDITVLVPENGMTVNGETRLVLSVKDNGKLASGVYAAKAGDIPVESGIVTPVLVGTKDEPLLDSMKFRFTDKAGNSTEKNKWEFAIDAESDLPVA